MPDNSAPVVIVGGGIAGLTTAVYLARAGRDTVILERAKEIGGRAQTQPGSLFMSHSRQYTRLHMGNVY